MRTKPIANANARAIIVPHAGYSYLGDIAAVGYKHLQNMTSKIYL